MAIEVKIGGDGALFVGEDKTIVVSVVNSNDVPVNAAGWTTLLVVRTLDTAADPAIFSLSGVVTGSYNVDPLLNSQVISYTLTDDQLNTVKKKVYRYSVKRMDAGFETILAFGDFEVEKATAE